MAKRIDIDRREKRPKDRSKRLPLTTGKMWQVVAGLFVMFTVLAGFFWLLGADLDSEYRHRVRLSTNDLLGAETRGRRLSVCGFARVLLPESMEQAIPCIWWNLGAFYIMPAIALFYAVKETLTRLMNPRPHT